MASISGNKGKEKHIRKGYNINCLQNNYVLVSRKIYILSANIASWLMVSKNNKTFNNVILGCCKVDYII